jgi:hypothetical protein
MMKWAPWLIGLLGLGIVAYGLMLKSRNPPRVVATAEVRVTHPRTGQVHTLRTRKVEVAGFVKEEVELPGGTWIDCLRGDCAETVRAEHFELFDTLRDKRP